MSMLRSDLTRKFVLTVSKNGAVFIHLRGTRAERGTLPVFSTHTREEAEGLRVRHCRLSREDNETYFLNEPPIDVDDLDRISELFRATYAVRRAAS